MAMERHALTVAAHHRRDWHNGPPLAPHIPYRPPDSDDREQIIHIAPRFFFETLPHLDQRIDYQEPRVFFAYPFAYCSC